VSSTEEDRDEEITEIMAALIGSSLKDRGYKYFLVMTREAEEGIMTATISDMKRDRLIRVMEYVSEMLTKDETEGIERDWVFPENMS
jgi:hypothetical protein